MGVSNKRHCLKKIPKTLRKSENRHKNKTKNPTIQFFVVVHDSDINIIAQAIEQLQNQFINST